MGTVLLFNGVVVVIVAGGAVLVDVVSALVNSIKVLVVVTVAVPEQVEASIVV